MYHSSKKSITLLQILFIAEKIKLWILKQKNFVNELSENCQENKLKRDF